MLIALQSHSFGADNQKCYVLKNYFTIFIRNILRRKFFASINILGLTAALTACFLIALYVIDEFSYDRFHVNAGRIYQVGVHRKFGVQDVRTTTTCAPMAPVLMSEIPEVESVLRLTDGGKPVFRYGEKVFSEDKVFVTDSNFFQFFSFKLISGNAETALTEPNTVVLTEQVALKYFGHENPLEKLIIIGEGEDKITYKVTGVAADCPSNSHLDFNVLMSAEPFGYFQVDAWLNGGIYNYFLL